MSNTSAWVYTNTATVKPFLGRDSWTQEVLYDDEITIACTWEAKSEQVRDSDGAEFVSRYVIYTEDARPKKLDLIQLNGDSEWQEIRSKLEYDMSFFDETPDFELVT